MLYTFYFFPVLCNTIWYLFSYFLNWIFIVLLVIFMKLLMTEERRPETWHAMNTSQRKFNHFFYLVVSKCLINIYGSTLSYTIRIEFKVTVTITLSEHFFEYSFPKIHIAAISPLLYDTNVKHNLRTSRTDKTPKNDTHTLGVLTFILWSLSCFLKSSPKNSD